MAICGGWIVKGALVGKGMTAEAYEWGQDRVIKFYYDWFEQEWIQFEMEKAKAVNEAGVPCF